MNAPAQGVLPWFYNEVLPLGEDAVLSTVRTMIYEPLMKDVEKVPNPARQSLASSPAR